METKMTDTQRRIQLRRQMLKEMSAKAREYREAKVATAQQIGNLQEAHRWMFAAVNDAIIDMYHEQTGASEFRTFNSWNREGYFVKRGEHAFVVWGKRLKNAPSATAEGENDYSFFPVAYLFSDKQVKAKKNTSQTTLEG